MITIVDLTILQPCVVDDDGIITVLFNGKELRGWTYSNDRQRRIKMELARAYVEGWLAYSKQEGALYLRDLHLRQDLRKMLERLELTSEVRKLISDELWRTRP